MGVFKVENLGDIDDKFVGVFKRENFKGMAKRKFVGLFKHENFRGVIGGFLSEISSMRFLGEIEGKSL